MKFRHLVSVAPVKATDPDYWCGDGEPVVPWFPVTAENVFLGLNSQRKSLYARVAEIDGDPDEFVDRLRLSYPGLPVKLLTEYVWRTHLAAERHDVGDTFQVFISAQEAKLQKTGTMDYDVLWEEQPL